MLFLDKKMPAKIIYKIGQRLHDRTRLSFIEIAHIEGKNRKAKFRCDCGNEKVINIFSVKSGDILSCGCLYRETTKTKNLKHGMYATPEYIAHEGMIQRCCNSNNPGYKNYGGRGISVCDRWLESFENFYADMGRRPSGKHSIDRIDNNGNYTSDNCRWATMKTQTRNKRTNNIFAFNGESHCIAEWADIIGVKYDTLYARLITHSWTVESALTKPKKYANRKTA